MTLASANPQPVLGPLAAVAIIVGTLAACGAATAWRKRRFVAGCVFLLLFVAVVVAGFVGPRYIDEKYPCGLMGNRSPTGECLGRDG